MEPRYRAACDGYERERENGTRNDRTAAGHELGERRHLEIGMDKQHADDEGADRCDLHEGA